jgi:hypothetical protein
MSDGPVRPAGGRGQRLPTGQGSEREVSAVGLGVLVFTVCAVHFLLGIVAFVWIRIRHW